MQTFGKRIWFLVNGFCMVCVCACACACVCVCACACVCVYHCVYMYESMCVCMSMYICDWICKKGSCTCNYKYLGIQFWNIEFNISWEWLELPACVSPQIYD